MSSRHDLPPTHHSRVVGLLTPDGPTTMITVHPVEQVPTRSQLCELFRARLCDLVRRSGLGDQHAFAEFYAETVGYVTALVGSGCASCSADLTVATYVALWADAPRFDPDHVEVWSWVAGRTRATVRDDDRGRG